MVKTHRPSGGMCAACMNLCRSCEYLDFASMQIMKKDKDGVKVVKCNQFIKLQKSRLEQLIDLL